jgi:hypothetical protein
MDGWRPGTLHRRRLREVWRSAGWPCRDAIEIELLAAGLLQRQDDGAGRETLRVTEAGVLLLAATLQRNRAARDGHEALVARVALEMQRAGRVVWRGLTLRAPLPALAAAVTGAVDADLPDAAAAVLPDRTRWVMAMPDVYSIRHTTLEDATEPIVHEIKVRRSDLLADLRRPDKGAAYRALASQCWYVLHRGIGDADDVPPEYGVMLADEGGLEVQRPAPRRALRVPFAVWMALARARPELPPEDDAQAGLN